MPNQMPQAQPGYVGPEPAERQKRRDSGIPRRWLADLRPHLGAPARR